MGRRYKVLVFCIWLFPRIQIFSWTTGLGAWCVSPGHGDHTGLKEARVCEGALVRGLEPEDVHQCACVERVGKRTVRKPGCHKSKSKIESPGSKVLLEFQGSYIGATCRCVWTGRHYPEIAMGVTHAPT